MEIRTTRYGDPRRASVKRNSIDFNGDATCYISHNWKQALNPASYLAFISFNFGLKMVPNTVSRYCVPYHFMVPLRPQLSIQRELWMRLDQDKISQNR